MSPNRTPKLRVRDLVVHYGSFQALHGVNIDIEPNEIIALIGPSGCGKSTFLRTLNRMNDPIKEARVSGVVEYDGRDIYNGYDVIELRRRIGMVFQSPNPFPTTIYENVAFGPRVHGISRRKKLDEIVEHSLRLATLWKDVSDRLHDSALSLSGGQQQRLCIARTLAVEPDVILMDEPTSALDPVSISEVEDLLTGLSDRFTILIVTHNLHQAGRISHRAAFFLDGRVVEVDTTLQLLTNPTESVTQDYIFGKFG